MADKNGSFLPFEGGSESADNLKKVVEEVFALNSLDMKTLKSYMEPAFAKEGYRRDDRDLTKRIAIIRLDEIGDNVMTSGFIRELRKNYPTAHITLIVNPTVYPLVEFCPYVNEVIGFSVTYVRDLETRFFEILKLCYYKLWSRHFDMVFLPRWDMDNAYFGVFLAYFSGAKERIGYSAKVYDEKAKQEGHLDELLTKAVISPPHVVHEAARNFYLLEACNLKVDDYRQELWYTAEDYEAAEKKTLEFSKGRKLIAVVPGGNTINKIYPPDKFIVALKKIKREDNCFLLFGGGREKEIAEHIRKNLGDNAALNLAGATSLRETAAAVSLCGMYIGMDTGVKHIAAALGLPVVEISRTPLTMKSSPLLHLDRFAPWQTPTIMVRPKEGLSPCKEIEPCDGCSYFKEPHCITGVKPEDIAKAYEDMARIAVYDKI
ncbi:MAG: glycosyltransferase family 9 protein [Selenomonadaceae bacterium]|nr:glycosyltransferase family 9 protein [Selenomonadaceae bacterium]